jgi:hypothetical protein
LIQLVFGVQASNKRREEAHEANTNVNQPFDSSRFDFNKAREDEIMFYLTSSSPVHNSSDSGTDFGALRLWEPTEKNSVEIVEQGALHFVLVNVSPLMLAHSIIAPFAQQNLPQVTTRAKMNLSQISQLAILTIIM